LGTPDAADDDASAADADANAADDDAIGADADANAADTDASAADADANAADADANAAPNPTTRGRQPAFQNRSRRNDTDRIQPLIRLADGQLPVAPHLNNGVVFPANQIVLQAMTEAEIDVLLTFYALPTGGTVNAKLIRLMQHLGMTL
jgi:hypothetical protein